MLTFGRTCRDFFGIRRTENIILHQEHAYQHNKIILDNGLVKPQNLNFLNTPRTLILPEKVIVCQ